MTTAILRWPFRHPIILMALSVSLWMLYPPLVNYLADELSIFAIAAFAHTIAGAVTVVFFGIVLRREAGRVFRGLRDRDVLGRLARPVVLSGVMVFLNHLLLYGALASSTEFDVVAILVFEIWPIFFFYLENTARRGSRAFRISDYVFSGVAFAGLIVLTAPSLRIEDWILLEGRMLKTMAIALAGGLAMAGTCYYRMRSMEAWREVSTGQGVALSNFGLGLLTESSARALAAPLFITALLVAEPDLGGIETEHLLLIAFIGVVILAAGSVLYDMAVFASETAGVAILWYLMPVGSIAILAMFQGRLLNEYEAVAAVLIVASNIFLSLGYPVKNSLTVLFGFVAAAGIWVMFIPGLVVEHYYEILSVSLVFFVLLSAFMLERTAGLNLEREAMLSAFRQHFMQIHLTGPAETRRAPALASYLLVHVQIFLRAFSGPVQLNDTQRRAEELKADLLEESAGDRERTADMLALFQAGDRISAMETDRISPSEYVILFLLGGMNILFTLLFRPDSFASAVFALAIATAAIYLLLVIYERDKYPEIRHDHALMCRHMLADAGIGGADADMAAVLPVEATVAARVRRKIADRTEELHLRTGTFWAFLVYFFLIAGFGYGFLFQSFDRRPPPELSPMAVVADASPTVGIGLLDWPSARLKAFILEEIVSRYTQFDAAAVPASNAAIFRQMNDGSGAIDVHPEFWVDNNPALVRRYVQAFETVALGRLDIVGQQGLCEAGPRGTAEPPPIADLARVSGERYDFSGDGRGDIWIGAEGWGSTEIEARRLAAYGLDEAFEFHVFDDKLMRRIVRRRIADGQPTLFYCYYPDAIFNRGRVSVVAEPAHEADAWSRILAYDDLPPPDLVGTSWPETRIATAYRADIDTLSPELASLLAGFAVPNDELVGMLDALNDGTEPRAIARSWVDAHEAQILQWMVGGRKRTGG